MIYWFLFTICMINAIANIIIGNLELAGVMGILAFLLIDRVET